MEISEAIDRVVRARWRHDLINMLTDAGRTLAGTGLRANGTGEIIRGNKADHRSQGMGRDVADDGIQLRTGGQ